jgi:hypothetical protein
MMESSYSLCARCDTAVMVSSEGDVECDGVYQRPYAPSNCLIGACERG